MLLKEMQACAAETLTYFMQTMPNIPFLANDINVEFVQKKDMASRVKAFCAECCPDRVITDNQSFELANSIAANAIICKENLP